MLWSCEDLRRRPRFDEPPFFEHEHPAAVTRDDAEIVGDQQQRSVLADLFEQREYLCLHGDVERRRRFVRDKELRLSDQRLRDHGALAHAAGQLVGIRTVLALRVGEPDPPEHVDDPVPGAGAFRNAVPQDHLPELSADADEGVQRLHRVLEDDPDLPCPQPVESLLGGTDDLRTGKANAARHVGVAGQEPEHGERGLRFPGTRFPDEADCFARGNLEAQHVHDRLVRVADRQALDLEQARRLCAHR